jgi:hypothetical protein
MSEIPFHLVEVQTPFGPTTVEVAPDALGTDGKGYLDARPKDRPAASPAEVLEALNRVVGSWYGEHPPRHDDWEAAKSVRDRALGKCAG